MTPDELIAQARLLQETATLASRALAKLAETRRMDTSDQWRYEREAREDVQALRAILERIEATV